MLKNYLEKDQIDVKIKEKIKKGIKRMTSIEEKVEDFFKKRLDKLKIKRYTKTESINRQIKEALKNAESKTGGKGGNYPDIQILLDDHKGRTIPVMIEVKGRKNKLEKLEKDQTISTKQSYVNNYAVNGAYHYGMAILQDKSCPYHEVIIVGINASNLEKDLEVKGYYIAEENGYVPKQINEINESMTIFVDHNIEKLYQILDNLKLTEQEQEEAVKKLEVKLEGAVKTIHQVIYEDERLRTQLGTNDKLYLMCGLIMAGLSAKGIHNIEAEDLYSNDSEKRSDGKIILNQVEGFLCAKECDEEKVKMVMNLLTPVFTKSVLWKPSNGMSILKELFMKIKAEVIPYLTSPFHLDFTGRILNCLNDWVAIENDAENDVVLTPRYITKFMAKLCRTNKDSWVWDSAMGSGGFLVSAMDLMIRDAQNTIQDEEELKEKINKIKKEQLLGIEILGNIFILAVLNMVLMGDGSSNLINDDSHLYNGGFKANVFLLNPPYSAEGKGLIFVEEATKKMANGYACVLIQENAGTGQGDGWGKKILEHNTLLASIHMPDKLFTGKASVQTSIYLFKVNEKHDPEKRVKFFDFSNDGYSRQNRRKSTQEINLQDTDHAKERYEEVIARILGKNVKTEYYTKENGLYIEDTISLEGNDWAYFKHRVIDTTPTEEDFKKTVADYLAWKVAEILKGSV